MRKPLLLISGSMLCVAMAIIITGRNATVNIDELFRSNPDDGFASRLESEPPGSQNNVSFKTDLVDRTGNLTASKPEISQVNNIPSPSRGQQSHKTQPSAIKSLKTPAKNYDAGARQAGIGKGLLNPVHQNNQPSQLPAQSEPKTTEWVIDSNLPLPAVLSDLNDSNNPVSGHINEQIIQEFEQSVNSASTINANGEQEITDEQWESARRLADQRFKVMYGDDAYNRQGVSTAMETTPAEK